jgi:hypothetical protein
VKNETNENLNPLLRNIEENKENIPLVVVVNDDIREIKLKED